MKKTTVFITHDLDEAVRVGHRIAIMRDGQVIQIGTPEDIVVNPVDKYVEEFVRGISRLKVVKAHSIMKPISVYKSSTAELSSNFAKAYETDNLNKLVEISANQDHDLMIYNQQEQEVGVVTKKELLKSIVEENQ